MEYRITDEVDEMYRAVKWHYEIKQVPGRVKKISNGKVFVLNEWRSLSAISPASDAEISAILKRERGVRKMLHAGDRLMSCLQEPEYI
jgi:hypothetical protein